MRTKSGAAVALCALFALLGGCLGANRLADGQAGAPGVQKFLVCAPNTVIALPAELQEGSEPLHGELDAYLRHHGREVEWLDLYESQQVFAKALARAKEQGNADATPALFAEELAKTRSFDAVVLPSILLHEIRVLDNSGRWDGVSRQIPVLNKPTVSPDGWGAFEKGVRSGGYTGKAGVTSVHLLVLSRAGARVFEGRGGVEFVHEIDLAAKEWRFAFRVRDDLFQDAGALREGIVLAFDPYLPPPEDF